MFSWISNLCGNSCSTGIFCEIWHNFTDPDLRNHPGFFFSSCFLYVEDDYGIFLFSLFIWWVILVDFWILNHHCIPGRNSTCSQCIIFSMQCWFFKICLEISCLCLWGILVCHFLLKQCLSVLAIRITLTSLPELRNISSSAIFLEKFGIDLVLFLSLTFARIHQWSHLGLEFSCEKIFKYKFNFFDRNRSSQTVYLLFSEIYSLCFKIIVHFF